MKENEETIGNRTKFV